MTPLQWAAVVCGGGAVLFVAAELMARAYVRRKGEYFVWAPGMKLKMHLEPGVLPSQGPVVRFDVNADGERGDDFPVDAAAAESTYRVVTAGGSAVECYLLDQPQSWPEVLKRELARPERLSKLGARAVHVGNLGKSLIGTELIVRIFGNVFPRYRKLDCVVFMVGASNVFNWMIRKTPTEFSDGEREPADVYDAHPALPFRFTPRWLALRWIWKRRRALKVRPVAERRGVGKKLVQARAMRKRATTFLDSTPDPGPMVDHFERNVRALIRRTKEKAGRVVVVRQPWFDKDFTEEERDVLWHGAQGQPYLEEVKTYYTFETVHRLMELVDARMAKVAAEEGVECLNLRPLLDHSLRTFYDYLHFTPEGAAVVGRRIAEFMNGERPSPP